MALFPKLMSCTQLEANAKRELCFKKVNFGFQVQKNKLKQLKRAKQNTWKGVM